MPAPSAPPAAQPERVLPDNLDELVRRAMRGGGVGALKQALTVAVPVPVPVPVQVAPGAAAPIVARPAAATDEPADGAVAAPIADPLEALRVAAVDAIDATDVATRRAALHRARAALDEADAATDGARSAEDAAEAEGTGEAQGAPVESPPEPPDEGPPFRIPLARHSVALVIGAVGVGVEVGALAAALEVDLATARAAVLAGGTRIVLRAASPEDLERRRIAVAALGVPAAVISRDAILATEAALACVAAAAADAWHVIEAPRWGAERPDPARLPPGEPCVPSEPFLVTLGEVEERRLRVEAEPSRWQRTRYSAGTVAGGETRIAVIDVHTADGIYRFVEGAVDLRHFPGADANAQRQAMKRLQEALATRWPAVPVEQRRTCVATARPGAKTADGWPAWEEHSRVCRLLWLQVAAHDTGEGP